MLRIAIKEEERLEECFIEEESDEPLPGEIYKGIVKNIVPAIKCAFIDIGYSKNCFMYLDEKFKNKKLKKNDEVIVEVLKESIGDKGPKVTNAASMPGRYAVLMTLNNEVAFSQKIIDEEFKKKIKDNIKKPDDIGVMIRTNALDADIDAINEEIDELYNIYERLRKEATYSIKPKLLYRDEGALDRILRDSLNEYIRSIYVDNEEDFNYVSRFIKKKTSLKINVLIHSESRTLLDYYGIEKEILNLRNNRVSLKSGGYLVIDKTEAMYVIDVNSGKNIRNNSIEKTALEINLEAASEIARQIKLRNLSGIIVIDFIDIERQEYKDQILEILLEFFKKDKNKTKIFPFTELNLVQIARRRRGKSIYQYIEEDCYSCFGRGKRIRFDYLVHLLRNEYLKIQKEHREKDIYIQLNHVYEKEVLKDRDKFISNLEASNINVYVRFMDNVELYKIEPLIFSNQSEKLQTYKIYDKDSLQL